MEPFKEKTVGCALATGVTLIICSLGLTWLFSVAGIYRGTYTREPITNKVTDAGTLNLLTITFIVIGVLIAGGAIAYGLWLNANRANGPRKLWEGVRVVARYGYSGDGVLLVSEWELEVADNPKYYVRLLLPDGHQDEFECTPSVFFHAGEGMVGDAEVQSKWLGHFRPHIGVPNPASGPSGVG